MAVFVLIKQFAPPKYYFISKICLESKLQFRVEIVKQIITIVCFDKTFWKFQLDHLSSFSLSTLP